MMLPLVALTTCLMAESDFVQIPDRTTTPILNPALSQRKTDKIRLSNGLEAYLISDPQAEKSAAAMVVMVGSWQDPDAYPGMAHFVEHTSFLGTKKYPEESAFDRFIGQHGGLTNASTSVDHTVYEFSVNSDAFPQALDRFSDFFTQPLFNPAGIGREVMAIDQEFSRLARTDEGRTMLVIQSLNNPKHPNSRFTVGNKDTLTPVSRDVLLKWYYEHYSANLMRLIVYSSMDLDTLRKTVVEDFRNIPNRNLQRSHFHLPMYGSAMRGTMSLIESLKDARTVTLRWELPSEFTSMRDRKPEEMICFVLGHEGAGSLLAELKEEGYAENLYCGADSSNDDNFLAYLQVELTKKGLKDVDLVLERIFQAIDNFKAKGAVRYLFDEDQRKALLAYQYQERQDAFTYVTQLADALADEDMATFPEQSFLIEKYDPKAIAAFLDALSPQNAHITIRAPAAYLDTDLNQVEKWAGTKFATRPISPETLAKWKNLEVNAKLSIPPKNPFMPQNLQLIGSVRKDATAQPDVKTLLDDETGHLYYARDEYYQVPQTYVYMNLLTPQIDDGDAKKAVLADLYVKALQENLNALLYQALMGGLDCQIDTKRYALAIEISGFSEHAAQLLQDVVTRLKTLHPTPQEFAKYKESLSEDYRNFSKEAPLTQASEALSSVLHKDFSTHRDKAQAIQRMTAQDLLDYIAKLWDKQYVQGIFYGNLTEDEALHMGTIIRNGLGGRPYPLAEHKLDEIADLVVKGTPYYVIQRSKTSGNAVILAIQNPPYSATTQAIQNILSEGLSASFFDTLRTQQQTGYAVGNWDQELERRLFLFFGVESDTHDGRDLLARFELFLENFVRNVGTDELTEAQFDSIKEAYLRKLEKPAQNLKRMGQILGVLSTDYDGDFDWMKKRITAMHALSYTQFVDESKQVLSPNNRKRLAVILKGISEQDKFLEYVMIKSIKELRGDLKYEPRGLLLRGDTREAQR